MIDLNFLTYDKYIGGNISLLTKHQHGFWIWILVISAILGTVYLLFKTRRKSAASRKMLAQFQGPKPYPLIGNVLLFSGNFNDLLPIFSKLVANYGRRTIVWLLNKPFILLSEAKDIELFLSSQIKTGDFANSALRWAFGDSLVTSKQATWKADRKLLSPAFKYQRFDGFLETFNKHGKELVKNLEKEMLSNNQNFDQAFALCTMDSLVESTFGVESNLQQNGDTKFFEIMKKSLEAIRSRIFKPWLQLPVISYLFGNRRMEKKVLKISRDFFNEVIQKRRTMSRMDELNSEKTKPLLDVLMTSRGEQNIFDHMLNIFTAGFETTSRALMYTLYLLASNPEHQTNVQEEIDNVFDVNLDGNITYANLTDLKYLERCILESLRIFPPIPLAGRNITSDLKLDETHVIPKGTEVYVDFYHLHQNPETFPDPQKFDPDRFLPEVSSRTKVGAYAPFSMGPRSCLGQRYAMIQLKVLLCHVLRNFEVSTTLARKDLKLITAVILEPSKNIPLKLTRRANNSCVQ